MINKMMLIFAGVTLVFMIGCSATNDVSATKSQGTSPYEPGNGITKTIQEGSYGLTFYSDRTIDWSDLKNLAFWNITWVNQMAVISNGITGYKLIEGKWPGSWSDILNGYLPFLPSDPDTGETYALGNAGDSGGDYTAGTIVADIQDEGWDLYCAQADKDGVFTSSRTTHQELASLAEGSHLPSTEPRRTVFRVMLFTWTSHVVGDYLNRHKKMPGTKAELMEGYVRNPSTTLGYDPNPTTGEGNFRIGLDPKANMWVFAYTDANGGEHFDARGYDLDEYGRVEKMTLPEKADINWAGLNWVLTQEDFK